jgi:hypothetical protein
LNAVEVTAGRVADLVDALLDRPWSRRQGAFSDGLPAPTEVQEPAGATCSCGSSIPIQTIDVEGDPLTLVGLPLIFQQLHEAGRRPGESIKGDLLRSVKIYNPIPVDAEPDVAAALLREYVAFCGDLEANA